MHDGPDDWQHDLMHAVEQRVAGGFATPNDVLRDVIDYLDTAPPKELKPLAKQLVAKQVAARKKDMARWPKVTDCDRLDLAFEELNALGIMARHNWTCCGTCGRSEMPDEFHRLRGTFQHAPIVGFAFYHQQDTESAADGGGLFIGYGSTEHLKTEKEYDARSVAVGVEVKRVLVENGLKVKWSGKLDDRIFVDLEWQRPRGPEALRGRLSAPPFQLGVSEPNADIATGAPETTWTTLHFL